MYSQYQNAIFLRRVVLIRSSLVLSVPMYLNYQESQKGSSLIVSMFFTRLANEPDDIFNYLVALIEFCEESRGGGHQLIPSAGRISSIIRPRSKTDIGVICDFSPGGGYKPLAKGFGCQEGAVLQEGVAKGSRGRDWGSPRKKIGAG